MLIEYCWEVFQEAHVCKSVHYFYLYLPPSQCLVLCAEIGPHSYLNIHYIFWQFFVMTCSLEIFSKGVLPYAPKLFSILQYTNARYSFRTVFVVTVCRDHLQIPKLPWGNYLYIPHGDLTSFFITLGQLWASDIIVVWICLCPSVCVCCNNEIVHAITHNPLKLESPHLDQKMQNNLHKVLIVLEADWT